MKISVRPPEDAKLIWNPDGVLLQNIFNHDYFWVLVEKDGSEIKFEINLPEWLTQLTRFLKETGEVLSYKKNMTLSGDNFIADKHNGLRRINVYDHNQMQLDWLTLSEDEARLLHARLVCELIETVEKAAGKPLNIRDIDNLEIQQVV